MKILLTGGAGYIGSHTYLELCASGHIPVIIDNFENSSPQVIDRLEEITGAAPLFHKADVRDTATVRHIIADEGCEAVVHFAGLKSVAESVEKPLAYYDVNVGGTMSLLEAMEANACKKLIFSSSATVYGDPQYLPIDENHPLTPQSVYGDTKLVCENMMRGLSIAGPEWSIVLLRYFNPAGADSSARIGEEPRGTPNNLMPIVTRVASGQLDRLLVYGSNFDTPDGTGVRDYIHVRDLATGHVSALSLLDTPGCTPINLGTGNGHSVLDVVRTFQSETGQKVAYEITDRRAGDVAACYADATRALQLMGWRARLGLDEMCRDAWCWLKANPKGYKT